MGQRRSERIIGLISDTHGLVRPSVHAALAGVEVILHAGDVGGPEVLDELGAIAPVLAVFGNTDPPGVPGLEPEITLTIEGISLHVSHGHELGSPHPDALLASYREDVLVYGHTHRQLVHRAGERLVVNPGAAGPRRFNVRPSVARLTVSAGQVAVDLVDLDDD
jgi:putative phosphoesterase